MQVIFVCLGNICRSPLAEAIFVKKLEDDSVKFSEIRVLSAGTSDWNVGDGADSRSISVALQKDYRSILDHRAKKLSLDHLSPSDHTMIICMDHSNQQNVMEIIGNQLEDAVSVHLFSDFGVDGERGIEVPDPYYGDIEDFRNVLVQCEQYSDELINFINQRLKI